MSSVPCNILLLLDIEVQKSRVKDLERGRVWFTPRWVAKQDFRP